MPAPTVLFLAFLIGGVNLPMNFLGGLVAARRRRVPDWPTKPHKIPRLIPEKPWYMSTLFFAVCGGLVLHALSFVQVYYIVSKLWLHQFVYMFGFLLLAMGFLAIGCAEISIIATYLNFVHEDYNWWWRSFAIPAASGGFLFIGILSFIVSVYRELSGVPAVTYGILVSYSFLAALLMALVTGAVGLSASMAFTRVIFSIAKSD